MIRPARRDAWMDGGLSKNTIGKTAAVTCRRKVISAVWIRGKRRDCSDQVDRVWREAESRVASTLNLKTSQGKGQPGGRAVQSVHFNGPPCERHTQREKRERCVALRFSQLRSSVSDLELQSCTKAWPAIAYTHDDPIRACLLVCLLASSDNSTCSWPWQRKRTPFHV